MKDDITTEVKKRNRSRLRPEGHRHPHLRQDKKTESEFLSSFKEQLLNFCGLGEDSFLVPRTALVPENSSKCILFSLEKNGLEFKER